MRKTNTKSTHLQCAWAKNTAPAKTGRAPARRSGARGIRSTKAEHGQTENRREETQRAPVHGWETESHPKRKHQHVQQPQHSEQQPQRQSSGFSVERLGRPGGAARAPWGLPTPDVRCTFGVPWVYVRCTFGIFPSHLGSIFADFAGFADEK